MKKHKKKRKPKDNLKKKKWDYVKGWATGIKKKKKKRHEKLGVWWWKGKMSIFVRQSICFYV